MASEHGADRLPSAPAARRVTDRFHVQKLAVGGGSGYARVKARWGSFDEESVQIAHAKACGRYIMRRSLKTVIHANSFFEKHLPVI